MPPGSDLIDQSVSNIPVPPPLPDLNAKPSFRKNATARRSRPPPSRPGAAGNFLEESSKEQKEQLQNHLMNFIMKRRIDLKEEEEDEDWEGKQMNIGQGEDPNG